jgi:hypothetical protein
MKKICTLRCQKDENRPPCPKTEFGAQNQYGRVIYPSIGNFTWSKGQKGKNKPSEPKNGIWGPKSYTHRNQYLEIVYYTILSIVYNI